VPSVQAVPGDVPAVQAPLPADVPAVQSVAANDPAVQKVAAFDPAVQSAACPFASSLIFTIFGISNSFVSLYLLYKHLIS